MFLWIISSLDSDDKSTRMKGSENLAADKLADSAESWEPGVESWEFGTVLAE